MESHDIVRNEKLIESDEISNKDVEMKCEIDEKEDQKEKQLLQQQQDEEYNCHDEIQEPEELIESEIATLLARNHHINILQNEKLKQSSINNVNNDNQELSNESRELKHVVVKEQEDEQIKNEELSDNINMKQENIVNPDINEGDEDRDDDREEEKEEEDNDKNLEKEKSTQGQDVSEDNPHFDRLSSMGRNRRVRQKNRYFLDFHCIDLTKGARSNKDDFDGFTTTTTSTRSSNRRSTTDSNRGQQDETDGIESRYCRKCSTKTMHDVDGGCQPCLYKKIVESSKRQRPGGQRNRSRQHNQHQQQQNDNEIELSSNTTTNKRKATRQGGGSKTNGNNSSNINTTNINNNTNINTTSATTANTITSTTKSVTEDTNVNNDNIVGLTTNESGIDKLPKLDSWTPDEVAEFILSKGFTQEAELFRMQSVDGISLLLMQRTDFTYGLKIKLGPALKIYDQVCKLKKEYFRSVATTN